jgi:hypothetical protein
MQVQREKPAGVDLLGVIMAISGIFAFFSGIDALFFASFLASVAPVNTSIPGVAQATAEMAAIGGSVILALGIGSFVVAYGLVSGRTWAWSGAVALATIGIVIPIMNVIVGYWPSIFTIMLSILVLYYLSRREVKSYFRSPVSAPSDAAAA